MLLNCGEVTNWGTCVHWEGGRKHHPTRGALGKHPLALSLISSVSKASLSASGEQLALSWSRELAVCNTMLTIFKGWQKRVSWSQSHVAGFQLTGAPNCLGFTFQNFVLFLKLMITKGRLKSHSSSVIFQIRTKNKGFDLDVSSIFFAVFMRVYPQRWESHWVG